MLKNKKLVGLLLCVVLFIGTIFALTMTSPQENDSQKEDTTYIKAQDDTSENQESKPKEKDTDKSTTSQSSSKKNTQGNTSQKEESQKETPQKDKKQDKPATQNNQTSEQKPQESEEHYVTLSIDCQTILNHMDELPEQYKKYVRDDGIILSTQKVKIKEGDTVYDVLKKVTKQKRIPLAQSNGYIQSINAIPEKLFNGSGGWMYSVNGEYANKGCKEYQLKNKDKIKWRYTCYTGDLY